MTTSTISPSIPAKNAPLLSLPIREQFQAAIYDINNLYSLIAQGATSVVVWTSGPVNIANIERVTSLRFTVPAIAACTLPVAAFVGETHTVVDSLGTAGTYNHTVTPTAGLIGGSSSATFTYNFQALTCVWDGVGWVITA